MLRHRERHRSERTGWLRAAVLGANDGIVSTTSLLVGIAAANAAHHDLIIAGLAGLVAGAMSMATGEYVSVSSQADAEHADLERERRELATDIEAERRELAHIYVRRGLDSNLAAQVADQLMEHDALGAHARDELGITSTLAARPIQAAVASALSFALGATLPLLTALFAPQTHLAIWLAATALVFLCVLGSVAARTGGANPLKGALRVTFWSALAMLLSAGVGALFGTAVG
jgi:VIT1/CCC1 family predicted Fe2+/Mn2+ transporter